MQGITESDRCKCPDCGAPHPRRLPPQLRRKAYMVWSNRMDSYRRMELTDAEWQRYDQRGSID